MKGFGGRAPALPSTSPKATEGGAPSSPFSLSLIALAHSLSSSKFLPHFSSSGVSFRARWQGQLEVLAHAVRFWPLVALFFSISLLASSLPSTPPSGSGVFRRVTKAAAEAEAGRRERGRWVLDVKDAEARPWELNFDPSLLLFPERRFMELNIELASSASFMQVAGSVSVQTTLAEGKNDAKLDNVDLCICIYDVLLV